MSESQSGNNAGIFTATELKHLFAFKWTRDTAICFVNWIVLRFQFLTMILCALRTENFERFRSVCVEGLKFHYEHRDGRGERCPLATAEYARVKNNKGDEEKQRIGIVCLCKDGIHKPITTHFWKFSKFQISRSTQIHGFGTSKLIFRRTFHRPNMSRIG